MKHRGKGSNALHAQLTAQVGAGSARDEAIRDLIRRAQLEHDPVKRAKISKRLRELVHKQGAANTAAMSIKANAHQLHAAGHVGIHDRGLPVRGAVQRPPRFVPAARAIGVHLPVPGGIARHLAAGGT